MQGWFDLAYLGTEDETSCPRAHHHDRWWSIKRQDAVDQYRLDASSPAERYRQLPQSEYTRPEYDGSKRVSNYLSGYVISAGSYYRGEPSALAAGFEVVGVQNQ